MKIRSAFFAFALPMLLATACSGEAATEDEEGGDEGALMGEALEKAFVGKASVGRTLPENFQNLDAHEKQKLVWERVIDFGEIRCNLAAAVRNARERLMDEMTTCERSDLTQSSCS